MLRTSNNVPANHKKARMEWEVVSLSKVPVKVLYYGGVSPSSIIKNPDEKPNELILILTGNPGLTEFYTVFASRVHEKTKIPVWVVSHGGHEDLPGPALSSHPDLYNLQGQLLQKQELIDSYLKGVKLHCIGHSIGCKILLDLLKRDEIFASNLKQAYLLFPTIEKMAETRNAARFYFFYKNWHWLIMFALVLWSFFPVILQKALVQLYFFKDAWCADPNLVAVLKLMDARNVRKVLYLADDEMKHVTERDDETIQKYLDKLRFYYSTTDGWVPVEYYENMKKVHPEGRIDLDEKGWDHSFMLKNNSGPVGDLVAQWINEEKNLKK